MHSEADIIISTALPSTQWHDLLQKQQTNIRSEQRQTNKLYFAEFMMCETDPMIIFMRKIQAVLSVRLPVCFATQLPTLGV